jgi:catechol 2,3-dioxygenase-like lactoylglutathione lyase family enzyme
MPALIPEFAVTDWQRSKAFYLALGFVVSYERPEEGFAYLTLGEAALMIDQIGEGRTFDDGHLPENYPFGRGLNVQIEVAAIAPLVDALWAMQHQLYLAPETRWYRRGDMELGNRQFVVTDPDGYLLRFFEDLGERPVGGPDAL